MALCFVSLLSLLKVHNNEDLNSEIKTCSLRYKKNGHHQPMDKCDILTKKPTVTENFHTVAKCVTNFMALYQTVA